MENQTEAVVAEKPNEAVGSVAGGQNPEPQTGAAQTNPAAQSAVPESAKPASVPDDGLLNAKPAEKAEGAGEEKTSEKPEDESANPVLGAPVNGYVFEEFPEGSDTSIVNGLMSAAKELNLSNDAAQKLLTAGYKGILETASKERAQLRDASLKDTDLGFKDGVEPNIARAYNAYLKDNPKLLTKLRNANLDVDPAFLRLMKAVGKDIGDSEVMAVGTRSGVPDRNDYRLMFPNTKMNR